MGVFDFLKDMLKEDNVKEEEDYTELSESMIMEMAKMKSKIILMQRFYPEKAKELEEKIENLEQHITDLYQIGTEEQQLIDDYFSEIQQNFQVFIQSSKEKFLFSETKRIYNNLDKIFMGKEEGELSDVHQLSSALELASKKKNEFTGIKQQQYIKQIIDTKYRVACCMMLKGGINCQNYFSDAPEVEKIFYANLLQKDIQAMYDDIEGIKCKYKIHGIDINIEEQEQSTDKLVDLIDNQYGESELTKVFNDNVLMNIFVSTRELLNRKLLTLDKDIEKKQQEKKEREQYKTLTEEELRQHIKELDDGIFDVTQSYKKILEYEKDIAKQRGLLNEKSTLAIDDVEIFRIQEDEIYDYIVRARESRTRLEVFPNIDDAQENAVVAKVKNVEFKYIEIDTSCWYGSEKLPKATKPFIKFMQDNNIDYSHNFAVDLRMVEINGKINSQILTFRKTIERIKEEKGNLQPNEIKFYIEMSYLRPMIPILRTLKREGIEYYILPTDEETVKKDPTKRIYMNREDLQKYKEKVHKQISDVEKGVITIGAEDMNEAKLMIGESEQYFNEKNRE